MTCLWYDPARTLAYGTPLVWLVLVPPFVGGDSGGSGRLGRLVMASVAIWEIIGAAVFVPDVSRWLTLANGVVIATLACVPIAYDPPVTDPSELDTVVEERAELGPVPITLQREPARRLANLSRFPIAVVTAESSMFLGFDRHLVEFLAQGGCDVELVRLGDHGVHGNGHMIMSERNNAETLRVLTDWAARKLGASLQ